MMIILSKLLLLATLGAVASAFVPTARTSSVACAATSSIAWTGVFTTPSPSLSSTTSLNMAEDEKDQEFMRWARASRSASSDDNVVELQRPLGLVLNQDDKGNVFVETVAPKGNAARTGKVRLGTGIGTGWLSCVGSSALFGCTYLTHRSSPHFTGQGRRYCHHVQCDLWRRHVEYTVRPPSRGEWGNVEPRDHLWLTLFLTTTTTPPTTRLYLHSGVGLTRVLAAIRVRSGPTVKLVFESPKQYQKKAAVTTAQRKATEDARLAAQRKKDELLSQLEQDEEKLKGKKFFGLF